MPATLPLATLTLSAINPLATLTLSAINPLATLAPTPPLLAPLSPLAFAAVVWGAVALVVLVFLYELVAVLRERA